MLFVLVLELVGKIPFLPQVELAHAFFLVLLPGESLVESLELIASALLVREPALGILQLQGETGGDLLGNDQRPHFGHAVNLSVHQLALQLLGGFFGDGAALPRGFEVDLQILEPFGRQDVPLPLVVVPVIPHAEQVESQVVEVLCGNVVRIQSHNVAHDGFGFGAPFLAHLVMAFSAH